MLIKHFEVHNVIKCSAWDGLLDISIKLNNEFTLNGNVET